MALLDKIQIEIAKKRIKHNEFLAFKHAGKEITSYDVKARELREAYGLQDWTYVKDY